MEAKYLIYGNVWTGDAEHSVKPGFAVGYDGTILAVGGKSELEPFRGHGTQVFQYPYGLLVPGFTEGHAHVSSSYEMLNGPYVNGESIAACQEQVYAYVRQHPEETVIEGTGFDPGLFGQGGPTRDLLDAVVPDRPVLIHDEGHHGLWMNTAALEACGSTRDTPDPASGHICKEPGTGEPTGFLQESGAVALAGKVLPKPSVRRFADGILSYQDLALSTGVTMAFEPMAGNDLPEEAFRNEAYRTLEREGKLRITFRVAQTLYPEMDEESFFANLDRLHQEFKNHEKLQYNTVKVFLDGVIDGHTAYLREPYRMPPYDCGPVLYPQNLLNERVLHALKKGYRVHAHAIGDAAIDEAIIAYAAAQKTLGGSDYRNQITHLQVCHEDQAEKMAEYGIMAVVNPYWHYETPLYAPLETPNLGRDRAEHMYYLKSFQKHGVRMSQASDYPVTIPPDTMMSLHLMVNRYNPKESRKPYAPEECLSVEEALRILTINGAYELDLEKTKGSIEAGKDADFVWLSQDVIRVPKEKLYQTKVLETWIQGECLYEKNQNEAELPVAR